VRQTSRKPREDCESDTTPASPFGGNATRAPERTTLRNPRRWATNASGAGHRTSETRRRPSDVTRCDQNALNLPQVVFSPGSLVQSGVDLVSSRRAVAPRSGDAAVAGAAPARSMLGFDPMPCHADLHHQRADSHRHDARQNEMKFIHAKPPPWPASLPA